MPWKLHLKKHFETTLPLSNEDGEIHDVTFHVARFTEQQRQEFMAKWKKAGTPASEATTAARKSDRPEEFARADDGKTFVLTTADIRARRLSEMTKEEYDAFVDQEAEEEAFSGAFVRYVVLTFVTMPSGQGVTMETEDGATVEVTTGEQIMQAFGHNHQTLLEIYSAVYRENMLTGAAKKALRSLSTSESSLRAFPKEVAGETPENPVAPVAPQDSVASAAVTASTAEKSGAPQARSQ